MSLPTLYSTILNDLNRDVSRHRPSDPLQYCADWFAARLRDERRANNNGAVTSAADSLSQTTLQADDPAMSAGGSMFSGNPFGAASGAARGAPLAEAGPADAPAPLPANFNFGRRTSVSAESMEPTNDPNAAAKLASSEPLQKTVIPKSESQMQRIRASIQNNLLFRNLDQEQERDVLLAMKEMTFEPNSVVIRQGDNGDYFYVVESGSLDVYIKSDMANGAGVAGRGSTGSILSTDSDGPASTHLGSTIAPGSDLSATLGERKVSYGPSDAFGELALMYIQPRAASIVTTSKCVLWALDRVTFRSIMVENRARTRAQLEKFLRGVHLFATLDGSQLAKLADALEFREYSYGQRIIEQGDRGDRFYVIVDGTVSVRKRRAPDAAEEDCGSLITGEYFGELALLNNAPRAASIVAAPPAPGSATNGRQSNKVKVAYLEESAFKRLIGSLASTMEQHASRTYFDGPGNQSRNVPAGAAAAGSLAGTLGQRPADAGNTADEGVDPHAAAGNAGAFGGQGSGRWVGGLGASPFASSTPGAQAAAAQ